MRGRQQWLSGKHEIQGSKKCETEELYCNPMTEYRKLHIPKYPEIGEKAGEETRFWKKFQVLVIDAVTWNSIVDICTRHRS